VAWEAWGTTPSAHPNFLTIGKISENLLGGKFLSKDTKFAAENPHLGGHLAAKLKL